MGGGYELAVYLPTNWQTDMYAAPDSQISQCFVTEASAVTTICGQIVLRLRKLRWRQQFAIARVNSEYTRRNWVPNSNHGLVIINISLVD